MLSVPEAGDTSVPGRVCSGEVAVTDIGITPQSFDAVSPKAFTMGPEDIADLPARPPRSHKGSFGHVLIMAGSRNMCGAAYLSALAAYRAGADWFASIRRKRTARFCRPVLPGSDSHDIYHRSFSGGYPSELCKWADAAGDRSGALAYRRIRQSPGPIACGVRPFAVLLKGIHRKNSGGICRENRFAGGRVCRISRFCSGVVDAKPVGSSGAVKAAGALR